MDETLEHHKGTERKLKIIVEGKNDSDRNIVNIFQGTDLVDPKLYDMTYHALCAIIYQFYILGFTKQAIENILVKGAMESASDRMISYIINSPIKKV